MIDIHFWSASSRSTSAPASSSRPISCASRPIIGSLPSSTTTRPRVSSPSRSSSRARFCSISPRRPASSFAGAVSGEALQARGNADEVNLTVPKLCRQTFETATIERYRASSGTWDPEALRDESDFCVSIK
jgi:hypothetical protein